MDVKEVESPSHLGELMGVWHPRRVAAFPLPINKTTYQRTKTPQLDTRGRLSMSIHLYSATVDNTDRRN